MKKPKQICTKCGAEKQARRFRRKGPSICKACRVPAPRKPKESFEAAAAFFWNELYEG